MKYAITGHTQGIGKCIFERLQPDIIGFSLSNDYDIADRHSRRKIVNDVNNCDVFINNAAAGFGQTLLLVDLYDAWKDTTKIIINVGSRIADDGFVLPNDRDELLQYQSEKRSLKTLSEELRLRATTLQVKYVSFAYVGTEKILAKYPDIANYISVDDAADIILGAMDDCIL